MTPTRSRSWNRIPKPRCRWSIVLGVGLLACGDGRKHGEELPIHELREEWRFVSNDSSRATSLTPSRGGTVLPDYRVITAHMDDSEVRVFDSTGRTVTLVGRAGQGPGEFRWPVLAGFSGDTIWIFELGRRAYVLFDRELRPIGQVRTDRDAIMWYGVVAGGGALIEPDRPTDASPRVIEFRDARGLESKPLALGAITRVEHRFSLRIGGRERSFTSPVVALAQLRVAPGGKEAVFLDPGDPWTSEAGRLTMRRIAYPAGEISAPITLTLPPRQVTAADRDTMIARATRTIRGFESDYRGAVRFPDHYPAFQYFDLIGLDGSFWLREFLRDDERLVLSPDGAPRMRVRTPRGLRLLGASATHVWGILTDADDVPVVLRYRIEPSKAD